MALGTFTPGAAAPLSPASDADEFALNDADEFAPETAALTSPDPRPEPEPLAEYDFGDLGSERAVDADSPDPWAEAFAEGSRLPFRTAVEPAYPVVANSKVQEFLDRFTGSRREVVSLWVNRSSRYLSMIREVFRSRGLPEELAFTAMIESGFKPDAVSRMGAKGMWQFMAPTARRYGLRVDSWVDERLDPEKSTIAAARYLSDLHGIFGSWALAQAAYNAGEVKIARAIRATGSSDFWKLAESRYLRRETKEFVPQIHAATLIGRDPDLYGFEFQDLEPAPVETVRVPAGTDLRRLASGAQLSVAELRDMNRVLVRGVTPPGATWELRVPPAWREPIMSALAPKRAPKVMVASGGRKIVRVAGSTDIHVVRPKDTISSIAKRYGVSVGDVVRWNSLARHDRIRPGDRLRIAAVRPSVEHDGQGGFR